MVFSDPQENFDRKIDLSGAPGEQTIAHRSEGNGSKKLLRRDDTEKTYQFFTGRKFEGPHFLYRIPLS
jgi:hypothetical protein